LGLEPELLLSRELELKSELELGQEQEFMAVVEIGAEIRVKIDAGASTGVFELRTEGLTVTGWTIGWVRVGVRKVVP